MNNDPSVSSVTSNKQFQNAVRYALDYARSSRRRPGAIPAPGIIPSMFLGALPRKEAIKQNLTRARRRCRLGCGEPDDHARVPERPDDQRRAVRDARAAVQANLQAAGFHVELCRRAVGTWLQKYRDGKMAFGLSLWGPTIRIRSTI
jgi:peptide/nickel transport system substrate-binding protein